MEQNKGKNTGFNIYYLNFSKVYEIAMMLNNVILTKIEKDNTKKFEKQYGFASSISVQGDKKFLNDIKSSISSDAKETSALSTRVVESLDVKTTKSILLRRVMERCVEPKPLDMTNNGDLVKIDNVKLELLDEESLRQFLFLKRDALKGVHVEGMEVNNLINSLLQDYAYILKGKILNENSDNNSDDNTESEMIIKIPMDIQPEFENKYSINDLLIGRVSIIGIYKGIVNECAINANTLTYFREIGMYQNNKGQGLSKIIKSNTRSTHKEEAHVEKTNKKCHFIDVLSVIQDVAFKEVPVPTRKTRWWNRVKVWWEQYRKNKK